MKKTDKVLQTNYRSFLVINTIGYLGITVHLALIPLFLFLGLEFLSFLNIFSFLMWIVAWRVNRLGYHDLAITLMISEVILHTLFVVPVVGWHAGFQYYLLGAIPFSLFNNKFDGKAIILVSIGLCITFIMLDVITHDAPQTLVLSASLIRHYQLYKYCNFVYGSRSY